MTKLEPQGQLIIIEPIELKESETEGGILTPNINTSYGKVIEFSPLFKEVYKKGDIVSYTKDSGWGVPYNGKACLYIDGNGWGVGSGEVWAIITEDKKAKK